MTKQLFITKQNEVGWWQDVQGPESLDFSKPTIKWHPIGTVHTDFQSATDQARKIAKESGGEFGFFSVMK